MIASEWRDYLVWVCARGVYLGQMQAIRAAAKANRSYNVTGTQADENIAKATDGEYVRADLAPAPHAYECPWTRGALLVRADAQARFR